MTKTEAIGKIFPEIESLISALLQEATDHTNDWKKNLDHPIKKEIEKRLDDLFAENSLFYELKGMLTEVIGRLPGLVDKEGKIDKESLTLLTNTWTAFKELKSEGDEKEETIVPTKEDFYKFLKELRKDEMDPKDKEITRLKIKLEKRERQNAGLKKKLTSLEAAERDRNDQLRQAEKKEQQKRDEIKTELESMINRLILDKIPAEELTNSRNRLKEMKNLLNNTGTKEQILKKSIKNDELKKVEEALDQIKLEEQRHKVKQRIADALADKGVAEGCIEIKEKELLEEYQDYSEILDEMSNLSEIGEFEREILQVIAKQRKEYQTMIEALSWGKKAISDGNVKQAERARRYLLDYRKLQLKQKETSDDYDFFLNSKAGEFHILISELEVFIDTTTQILQPTK